MSKKQFLVVLGVWIMVFLFLGFPAAWDKIFALVTGLLIIVIAFKHKTADRSIPPASVPYVERKNQTNQTTQTITSADQDMAP